MCDAIKHMFNKPDAKLEIERNQGCFQVRLGKYIIVEVNYKKKKSNYQSPYY